MSTSYAFADERGTVRLVGTLDPDPAGGEMPIGPAGGDLAGSTYPDPVIAAGKVTAAKIAAGAAATNLGAAGGDLAGAYPNPTIGAGKVTAAAIAAGAAATNVGAVGGDLGGTLPNPSVQKYKGHTLGTTAGANVGGGNRVAGAGMSTVIQLALVEGTHLVTVHMYSVQPATALAFWSTLASGSAGVTIVQNVSGDAWGGLTRFSPFSVYIAVVPVGGGTVFFDAQAITANVAYDGADMAAVQIA